MRFNIAVVVVLLTVPMIIVAEPEAGEASAGHAEASALLDALSVSDVLDATKASARELTPGKVIAVVSGDTVLVEQGDSARTIRLYGVDCPVPEQAHHEESKQFALDHFLQKEVTLAELTVDSRQHPVALVFDDQGISFSHLLAVHGMAWWDRQNAPDDALLRRLNADAITNERGLFANNAALAPWDYRLTHGMEEFAYSLEKEEEDAPPVAQAPEREEERPLAISARGTMTEDRPRAAAPPARPGLPTDIKDVDVGNLMIRHQPRIAKDDDGNPLGLTATDINAIPYAAQLGFRNGDIVTRVNGIAVESEAQIMSMIPQFRNTKQFNVQVLRNGRTETINITIP